MTLIIEYLNKFGKASRKDINGLLADKLSDVLDSDQKRNKIDYLLKKLKESKKVKLNDDRMWVLVI